MAKFDSITANTSDPENCSVTCMLLGAGPNLKYARLHEPPFLKVGLTVITYGIPVIVPSGIMVTFYFKIIPDFNVRKYKSVEADFGNVTARIKINTSTLPLPT